ncbi:MAG: hypothetical protein DMD83_02240, partial [Candidatus Rokuibacteriota bacterium]
MSVSHPSFRLLAFTLVMVLALTLAAPARAEALEPLTIIAIVGLVAVGVIIIVYLIVANVAGSRRTAKGEARYVTCVESDTGSRSCWAVPDAPAPTLPADI